LFANFVTRIYLNAHSTVLIEKSAVMQLVKKFPTTCSKSLLVAHMHWAVIISLNLREAKI